jgi:hypothetical protein
VITSAVIDEGWIAYAEERVGGNQGAGRGGRLERAKSGPVSMCRA